MTVHNHGPEDGPGLACNERRLPDGTLRGACLDVAEAASEELFITPGFHLLDVTREPHPTPCPDCGRTHLNGEHVRFQVPSAGTTSAARVVWEGCADCWVKRTAPAVLPPEVRDRLAQLIHLHHCDTHGPNRPRPVGPSWWADRAVADAVLAEVRPLIQQAQPKGPGVLAEVAAERARQDEKWGEQNHPDGTGDAWAFCSGQHAGWAQEAADDARRRCQEAPEKPWGDTYALILNEEVAEAFAEEDPTALRRELLQVAAVTVAWIEAIDRRPLPPAGMCTACGSVEVTLRQVTGTRDLSHIGESPEYPTGHGCELCS